VGHYKNTDDAHIIIRPGFGLLDATTALLNSRMMNESKSTRILLSGFIKRMNLSKYLFSPRRILEYARLQAASDW
jgi:hypothetical protein